MVGDHEVVVDGLRDMDAAQVVARLVRLLRDDPHGVRAVVAADVEETADRVRLQHAEDLLAVCMIGLVARRAERRGRRERHHVEVVRRLLREVHQLLVDNAAHAMQRAVDLPNLTELARFRYDAGQRLVDHRGGTTALSNQNVGLHGLLQGTVVSSQRAERVHSV